VTVMAAAAEDSSYVCQLDERSVEKAKKELNEDPKDRLNAVSALRTWIQQQPHITFIRGLLAVSILSSVVNRDERECLFQSHSFTFPIVHSYFHYRFQV